jgi:hypothetical protein
MDQVTSGGSRATRLGPHSLSVIVRAGHVIPADRAKQLTAPGLEPLRTDRTIPGNIFVHRGNEGAVQFCCGPAVLRCHSGFGDNTTWLQFDGSSPCFHGAFHGPTVIAHPIVREKRSVGWAAGRAGRVQEERAGLPWVSAHETLVSIRASFKCRMNR